MRHLAFLAMLLSASACTAQGRAYRNAVIELPECQKLMSVQWKARRAVLWYLTRPMQEDEYPRTMTYHQSTKWHVIQGSVQLVEHCPLKPLNPPMLFEPPPNDEPLLLIDARRQEFIP